MSEIQPARLEDDGYREHFNQAVFYHKNGDLPKAIAIYQSILNRLPDCEPLLLNLTDALLRMDLNGVAANLLVAVLSRNPKCAVAWIHLGLAYRKENLFDKSEECYHKALALPDGKTIEAYSGMASLFSDSAQPEKCIYWADKAISIENADPESRYSGYWEKALALLTMRKWDEGWNFYEYRKKLPSWDSRKNVIGKNIENCSDSEIYGCKSIYIHGEQGVGDEIMFASGVVDLVSDLPSDCDITIEVNAKCLDLFRYNFPKAKVISKEPISVTKVEIKVAMATLQKRLLDGSRFSYTVGYPGYLSVPQDLIDHYKEKLFALGPPPYIGIAWMGGAKNTRIEFRSVPLELFDTIRSLGTSVSLMYENHPGVGEIREHHNLPKIDNLSIGGDLLSQAALALACDVVVTCQQTLVHVCGAVGAKCFVMLPDNPHWRYGLEGEKMPWYGDNIVLLRKKAGETWKSLFDRSHHRISKSIS